MEATAVKKFTASMGGLELDCDAGDKVEADAKTIGQLEAMGLVTTKQINRAKPRKAATND